MRITTFFLLVSLMFNGASDGLATVTVEWVQANTVNQMLFRFYRAGTIRQFATVAPNGGSGSRSATISETYQQGDQVAVSMDCTNEVSLGTFTLTGATLSLGTISGCGPAFNTNAVAKLAATTCLVLNNTSGTSHTYRAHTKSGGDFALGTLAGGASGKFCFTNPFGAEPYYIYDETGRKVAIVDTSSWNYGSDDAGTGLGAILSDDGTNTGTGGNLPGGGPPVLGTNGMAADNGTLADGFKLLHDDLEDLKNKPDGSSNLVDYAAESLDQLKRIKTNTLVVAESHLGAAAAIAAHYSNLVSGYYAGQAHSNGVAGAAPAMAGLTNANLGTNAASFGEVRTNVTGGLYGTITKLGLTWHWDILEQPVVQAMGFWTRLLLTLAGGLYMFLKARNVMGEHIRSIFNVPQAHGSGQSALGTNLNFIEGVAAAFAIVTAAVVMVIALVAAMQILLPPGRVKDWNLLHEGVSGNLAINPVLTGTTSSGHVFGTGPVAYTWSTQKIFSYLWDVCLTFVPVPALTAYFAFYNVFRATVAGWFLLTGCIVKSAQFAFPLMLGFLGSGLLVVKVHAEIDVVWVNMTTNIIIVDNYNGGRVSVAPGTVYTGRLSQNYEWLNITWPDSTGATLNALDETGVDYLTLADTGNLVTWEGCEDSPGVFTSPYKGLNYDYAAELQEYRYVVGLDNRPNRPLPGVDPGAALKAGAESVLELAGIVLGVAVGLALFVLAARKARVWMVVSLVLVGVGSGVVQAQTNAPSLVQPGDCWEAFQYAFVGTASLMLLPVGVRYLRKFTAVAVD